VVEDAVPFEPVSPCNFGKCREILTKCREATNITQPKAIRSQKLRFDSPYSRSRETILPEQGGVSWIRYFVGSNHRANTMPEFVPNGYVSIHEALDLLGRELFPSEWWLGRQICLTESLDQKFARIGTARNGRLSLLNHPITKPNFPSLFSPLRL